MSEAAAKKPQGPGREAAALRVSAITVGVNLALAAGKLLAGLMGRSAAMVSDAVHSASDVFSTLVVMLGIHLAEKPADREHPYGHERLECVVSVVLALLLGGTGAGIGLAAAQRVLAAAEQPMPGVAALAAAVASILVKEGMYWYTLAAAKRLDSPALKSDAWHHRSDALSSVGSLVGIAAARRGLLWADGLAGLVICGCILKVAADIFRDAMDRMVDHACDPAEEQRLRRMIAAMPGVEGIDLLQTRMFGARLYVDVEIAVCGRLPLAEAHRIAEAVHEAVEAAFPDVKHCMVHVNPKEDTKTAENTE